MKDSTSVCGIKYTNSNRIEYIIKHFLSKEEAINNGFYVTHQGKCGACSTLQDLSVYLKNDLTNSIRKCAFKTIFSISRAKKCIKNVGFTDKCADIWLFNSIFTRKNCFYICMKSWILNEPNNKPNGDLNDCLKCDEDKSGPVFKYECGRNRRNSGIDSEIHRPNQQVYDIDQCYF